MDAERAKAIVGRYFQRLLNEQDLRVCDEMLADYVDHDAPSDTPPGPTSTKAYMRGFFAQHTQLSFSIDDIIPLIHGTADPTFPIEHGEALAEEIPGPRLLRLEGAGHAVDRADWETIAGATLAHTARSRSAT